MPAGYVDLYMDQGSTFDVSLNVDDVNGDPFNLTEFTASSVMKRSYYSMSPTLTFSTNTTGTLGVITLSSEASNTANVKPGTYVYDVKITDTSNNVIRILEGRVFVSPGVTLS